MRQVYNHGKLKRVGVCIYCGEEGLVTNEHVFPEAWYPEDTPIDVWRWQVPACYPCNHDKYGVKESKVFPFMAMGTEPLTPGAKGIGEKAWRAMDPDAASNARDRGYREKLRALMRHRLSATPVHELAEGAARHGMQQTNDNVMVTYVLDVDLLPVIGKIARGIVYIAAGGARVNENFVVRPFREWSKVPPIFKGMIAQETYSCGPGIIIDMIRIEPYPPCSFMQIRIWGDTYVWFVAITPKGSSDSEQEL